MILICNLVFWELIFFPKVKISIYLSIFSKIELVALIVVCDILQCFWIHLQTPMPEKKNDMKRNNAGKLLLPSGKTFSSHTRMLLTKI